MEEETSIHHDIQALKQKCCQKYKCTECVAYREKANIYGGTDTLKWCEFDTMQTVIENNKEILLITNNSYMTDNSIPETKPTVRQITQTTLSLE